MPFGVRLLGVFFGLAMIAGAFALGFWLFPPTDAIATSGRPSFSRPIANNGNADNPGNRATTYQSNSNSTIPSTPRPSPSRFPTSINSPRDAVQALRSDDPNRIDSALRWLSGQSNLGSHQDEICQALNPLVESPRFQSDTLRVLEEFATPVNTDALMSLCNKSTSSYNQTRFFAALGATGDPKAAALLASQMKNSDAKKALEKFGPQAATEVVRFVNDQDFSTRRSARDLLVEWNLKDMVNLQCAKDLASDDPKVVASAGEWLSKQEVVAAQHDEVAQALEQAIQKKDVPDTAVRALGIWIRPQSSKALIAACDVLAPDASQAMPQVITLLGKSKDPDAIPVLARALANLYFGSYAEKALQEIGPSAADAVLAHFHHSDLSVQIRARRLLKQFDIGTDALFKQTLKDLNGGERATFVSALRWLQDQDADESYHKDVSTALNVVLKLLREEGWKDRSAIDRCLDTVEKWGTTQNTDEVLRFVRLRNSSFTRSAIQALGGIGDPKSAPELAEALRTSLASTYAKAALIKMGQPAEDAVLALLPARSGTLQVYVYDILGKIGGPKTKAAMQDALRDAKSRNDIRLMHYAQRAIAAIDARGSQPSTTPRPTTSRPSTMPPMPSKPDGPIERKWTDITGSFTVQAALIGMTDGKLQLKRTSGSVIELPISRLSEADQTYARNELKKRADAR